VLDEVLKNIKQTEVKKTGEVKNAALTTLNQQQQGKEQEVTEVTRRLKRTKKNKDKSAIIETLENTVL